MSVFACIEVKEDALIIRNFAIGQRVLFVLFLLTYGLLLSQPVFSDQKPDPAVDYTPYKKWTTPFGPPAADVLIHPSNFLACKGAKIALCYYSGPPPIADEADLSCTITKDKNGNQFSNCRCIEIEDGPYFVDINAILDKDVYLKTVAVCGKGGQDCLGKVNKAPVCKEINNGTFLSDANPKPTAISTFSYQLNSAPDYQIGSTNCADNDAGLYSGCMTAPCVPTGKTVKICHAVPGADAGKICNELPIAECTCPNFNGPFQIGKSDRNCSLEEGFTWSAAFSPAQLLISKVQAKIQAGQCIPDAPGDIGCPLLVPVTDDPPTAHIPKPPQNINCNKVCKEYRNTAVDRVEVGFTCDATACTTPIGSRDLNNVALIQDACTGINSGRKGNLTETLKLEAEVGCSCCASQICQCDPSPATDKKVIELNEAQRLLGIEPQCDYNGTLCGKP